jgi:hypothetical protein
MTDEALALEERAQWIKQTLLEYARGGEDRIEECRELGEGLDWVEDYIENAEGLRLEWDATNARVKADLERARAAALSFILPTPQPPVESEPVSQPTAIAPSALREALPVAPSASATIGGLRRLGSTVAKPAIKAAPAPISPDRHNHILALVKAAQAKSDEAEVETSEAKPEQKHEPLHEDVAEDEENAANDVRRRLWIITEALKFIEPSEAVREKVGGVLWRMSEKSRGAGCEIWIGWLKDVVAEEAARKQWAVGFAEAPWCAVEELYGIAQRAGWRFPVAQNLNRLEVMTKRVEAALTRVDAEIYQSGGRLVRPVSVLVDATKGRKTRIARLVEINGPYLKSELTRWIDFFTWKKEVRSGIAPSVDVVSAMLNRYGEWRFPRVAGVICAPTLRRDGSVLSRVGWDPATELLVMGPLPEMPPVASKLKKEDAEGALRVLDGLLDEFPFVDEASRAAALSGLITPVVRAALTAVPAHASTAPAAGTGKSFLQDLAGAMAIGDAMPVIATGPDLTEMVKRLDAEIIAGVTVLSIDNASMGIGGDELCQIIERPAYRPRILGKSEMRERKNTWCIYITGKNLRLKDDVTRRTLLVRLDAKMERPELRQFRGNPLEQVLRNRGLYLWAALTIVRAYMEAGLPGRLPQIGDPFAEWSDLVRSALVWLGKPDPVDTIEEIRNTDPSRRARMAMFQALANAYGVGPDAQRLAAQMVADAKAGDIRCEGKSIMAQTARSEAALNLKSAIIQYTDNRLDARYLGNKLYTDLNSIAGDLSLRSGYDSHTKVNLWYVEGLA